MKMTFETLSVLALLFKIGSTVTLNSSTALENEMGKLIFANVLFRHGDRTPINPYPNDPYKNRSYWPVGFGQLTNTGKQQEYELGHWLKNRYSTLLSEEYIPEELYVQSTDVDRTLMSAASVLSGMYPPTKRQQWNPNIDWQPIPVHTIPEKLDKVLAAKAPCPAYDKEFQKLLLSKEIHSLIMKYDNVFKILNENCGQNVATLETLEYIFNTLFIENLYNLSLPAWTKGIFPEPMEEAANYAFALPTWTLKLARLKGGLLVEDMINHMKYFKDVDEHKPHPNVWMYSAHDSTVSSLLNTLGVFDLQNPPYSATVLMELRMDTAGNRHVTLLYRNSSTHEPYLLTLPGCTAVCPLDQFIQLCQPVIPQDWERECHSPYLFAVAQQLPYSSVTIAALVISSLLILLLVVSMVLYYQKRKRPPTHCHGFAQLFVIPWDGYKPFLHGVHIKSDSSVPHL